MAWVMQTTLGTTAAESLNACACVFLGMVGGGLPVVWDPTKPRKRNQFAVGGAVDDPTVLVKVDGQ
jgi:hypothetical protein